MKLRLDGKITCHCGMDSAEIVQRSENEFDLFEQSEMMESPHVSTFATLNEAIAALMSHT